jgi:hypothetical protein
MRAFKKNLELCSRCAAGREQRHVMTTLDQFILQCIWYMYLVGVPMNCLPDSTERSQFLNRGMVYMSVSGHLLAIVGY